MMMMMIMLMMVMMIITLIIKTMILKDAVLQFYNGLFAQYADCSMHIHVATYQHKSHVQLNSDMWSKHKAQTIQ